MKKNRSTQLEDDGVTATWMKTECLLGLISVIIPTYNRSLLLLEALTSVYTQTYRPIEIIVVDDSSTDNTEELVKRWAKSYATAGNLSLKYFCQPKGGACVARNKGLIESKGEYIQFFDSDDLLHPEKLERQVGHLLLDQRLDFVYSGTGLFSGKPDWSVVPYCGYSVPRAKMLLEFLYTGSCLWNTDSGVYRRGACIANGPWDESLPRFQDWEYNIRLLLMNTNVAHVPGLFSLARVHGTDRICDSPLDSSKIRDYFTGVHAVERSIHIAGKMSKEIRSGLASRYRRYTFLALQEGLDDVAREGVKFGMAVNGGLLDTFGFIVCMVILALPKKFESPATRVFLNVIAKFNRLGYVLRRIIQIIGFPCNRIL